MECLNNILLENKQKEKIKGCYIYRKYGNYNFYFLDTDEGLKEIKAIHIYEDNKKYLTLNKPWFDNTDEIVFDNKLKMKKNVNLSENEVFYIHKSNRKHIELYLPNTMVGFYKKGSEDLTGFYSKKDIFVTDNSEFGCHKEEVLTAEDHKFIKKIKDRCINKKNVMFIK